MEIRYMDDFDLTLEVMSYFLDAHPDFTTVWTEEQFNIYSEPVFAELHIEETEKTAFLEGIYENYQVQEERYSEALRVLNDINRELAAGCFYLSEDGIIVFRIKQAIYRQSTAAHDISLLIQILVMTMKRYFREELRELLR